MKTHILSLLILLTVSGCGSGGNNETTQTQTQTNISSTRAIADLEASGSIPTLDRSSNLTGTDSDNNGVRDDIDSYINSTYSSTAERDAVTKLASSFQETMEVDVSDSLSVSETTRNIDRSIDCIFHEFNGDTTKNPHVVVKEIESITSNTKERLTKYLNYNNALDGTVSSVGDDNCE